MSKTPLPLDPAALPAGAVVRRHPGLVLREEVHLARRFASAEIRRGQADAKAALAPALKTLGKPLRQAAKKLRPATELDAETCRIVASHTSRNGSSTSR